MAKGLPSASLPTLIEEIRLSSQGYRVIAGVDEAGRGPLAGPVVAGAVILPFEINVGWLHLPRDSKSLSEERRELIYALIKENAVAAGVGLASSQDIDRIGIGKASLLAMRLAVEALTVQPQFVLIDAFRIPDLSLPQKAIVKGDATCLSIAAASIVAKVVRDRLMIEMDSIYPGYGFARHKGYPTAQHIASLSRLGPCPIHRLSFAPVRLVVESLETAEEADNA